MGERDTYRGHIVVGADAFGQETISDFPGEDGRALPLKLGNFAHHVVGGYSWLASADGFGSNRTRLVVATQYLGDTTIADLQDA